MCLIMLHQMAFFIVEVKQCVCKSTLNLLATAAASFRTTGRAIKVRKVLLYFATVHWVTLLNFPYIHKILRRYIMILLYFTP